jgi:hypothetical protein
VIWSDLKLKGLHYRVLWWLIDMGIMAGALCRGWQGICAADLGVHRITLRRATLGLISKGVLVEPARGTIQIVPKAFDSTADPSRVKVLRPKKKRPYRKQQEKTPKPQGKEAVSHV